MILAIVLIAALVAEDQLIKALILKSYPISSAATGYYHFKIGDFRIFSITHIRNNGAGWSILGGKTVFLTVSTAVVIVAILIYLFIKRKSVTKLEKLSLCLIVAGGLGNLIDRLRMLIEGTDVFPGVIDYLKLDFIDFPVFNFADCCVVAGAILFCLLLVIDEVKSEKAKKAAKQAQNDNNSEDE